MTSKQLRQKYLDFFKAKGHAIIKSASLLPENDPTTLFTSSGMQPLVPFLLGEKHPRGLRLANSQKSFRAEDIDEIGDGRHTTFFEMLGNWSLGDYFKKEQLNWLFEFLTKELELDSRRLYVSVFRGNKEIGIAKDGESAEIWKEIFGKAGIQADGRIFYYGEDKNWWSRSGVPANMPAGEPGGPDSEVFYDLGADLKKHENSRWNGRPCHPNCDCGRFIEIGNSVFMEFVKTERGFEKLKQKNVDFGGGLERLTMATEKLDNIFETDLYINAVRKIEALSAKKYKDFNKEFEVIADHLKAAAFIMGDDKGVAPSNVGQGYVARRLIRRAIRYGRLLDIKEKSWTKEIAKIVAHDYAEIYPELQKNINFVIERLSEEEAKFQKTLKQGLKEFEKIAERQQLADNRIAGKEIFNLYQTYGFPLEMTKELASERGMEIDEAGYQAELAKHQRLSRAASAGMFKGGLADAGEATVKLHTAAHLLLAALRKILGDHVAQKGSNITAERLRFDFSHPEKLTDEQKQTVEKSVNEAIAMNLPVSWREMTLKQAKEYGAIGVFESKYGEKVKVYTVGRDNNIFSKEICGGPHVEKTGILDKFKIQKEESSSAGVRRIKAILE